MDYSFSNLGKRSGSKLVEVTPRRQNLTLSEKNIRFHYGPKNVLLFQREAQQI